MYMTLLVYELVDESEYHRLNSLHQLLVVSAPRGVSIVLGCDFLLCRDCHDSSAGLLATNALFLLLVFFCLSYCPSPPQTHSWYKTLPQVPRHSLIPLNFLRPCVPPRFTWYASHPRCLTMSTEHSLHIDMRATLKQPGCLRHKTEVQTR